MHIPGPPANPSIPCTIYSVSQPHKQRALAAVCAWTTAMPWVNNNDSQANVRRCCYISVFRPRTRKRRGHAFTRCAALQRALTNGRTFLIARGCGKPKINCQVFYANDWLAGRRSGGRYGRRWPTPANGKNETNLI